MLIFTATQPTAVSTQLSKNSSNNKPAKPQIHSLLVTWSLTLWSTIKNQSLAKHKGCFKQLWLP